MKNKWEKAFWWSTVISLLLLISIICISIYTVIDQAYTISYSHDSWSWEREDKNNLIMVINNTDFSKNEIIENYMIENDTINLLTIKLIFGNNKLLKIVEQ